MSFRLPFILGDKPSMIALEMLSTYALQVNIHRYSGKPFPPQTYT
jgi:hypothetical protein